MFRVFVADRAIEFTFHHRYFDVKSSQRQGITVSGKSIQAATQCFLNIDGIAVQGLALCSALDKFDKEHGRKLALTRALKIAAASKDIRTAVWERYHDRDIPNDIYEGLFANG